MLGFQSHIHIEARQETVFETLVQLDQWPDIFSQIEEMDILTPGPTSLGTKFVETRVIFGKKGSETMEVTGFEKPKIITTEAHSHGTHYVVRRQLTPTETGTQLDYIFEAHPQSLFARLMSFMARFMQKHMMDLVKKDLADLKTHIEGQ